MGTKAIRGKSKSTNQLTYFLSHGDTVILGSGNSKKTLTTKLSELDTALGHKVEWVDVYNYLETNAKMPVTNGYLFKGEPVDYFVIKGVAIVFRVWNATNSRFEYIGYTRTNDTPETWAFQSILQWSELTDNFKKAIDEGLVKAEEALSRLATVEEVIPATASSSNKLATASDVSAVATTANSALGKASTTEQLLPSDVNPETNKLTTEKKRAKVVVKTTQHGVTTTSELGKLVQIVASTIGGGYNLSKVFEVNEITGDNPGIEIVLPYLIMNSMISDGAVTTAKIVNGNVTKAKLAQDVLDYIEEGLADFKGTVETTAALALLTGNKNDWAVYKHADANNNIIYSRYIYDASYNDQTTGHWKFELDINSSTFTAAQWAAINSGATSSIINSVAGKAEKSEMSVTPGTGSNADKTTIQLKSGTSATVLTTHQDISGKANKVSGATNGNFAGLDANGNLTDSGKKASDFKTKQSAKSSPSASGNAVAFIDTISQDANGVITATKKTVSNVTASTNGSGGSAGLMTAAQAEKLGALPTNAELAQNYQAKLNTAQMNTVNSGINTTWVEGVDSQISAFEDAINGEGGIIDSLEETIKNLTILTADKSGHILGVLPEDDAALQLKQFYADSGAKICPLQVRQCTVSNVNYYVFVGAVNNAPGYVIFETSDNSYVGLGTLASPTAAHTSILYAAYPEFASSADMGGYEFDEVDVDTLLS